MTAGEPTRRFGCEHCWPESADAAHDDTTRLTRERELIAESHFHVMIRACPACGQRFLSVFTEMIDWVGGDDAQSWGLLPLTAAEADALIARRDALTENDLCAVAPGRRCLHYDHPTGEPARTFWGLGLDIPPHD